MFEEAENDVDGGAPGGAGQVCAQLLGLLWQEEEECSSRGAPLSGGEHCPQGDGHLSGPRRSGQRSDHHQWGAAERGAGEGHLGL